VTAPKRIQLRRTEGYRKPEGAVVVARPSKWGNPWTVRDAIYSGVPEPQRQSWLVAKYRIEVAQYGLLAHKDVDELRGKDLACWCEPDQPCHADVLLEIANQT
jgi:hypothetical protein